MNSKPYKFQKKAMKPFNKFKGRVLLGDDMGLGKTFQALYWIANHMKPKHKKTPVIIVCRASLKYNWEREILTHLGKPSMVCESRKPPTSPNCDADFVIINWEILGFWKEWLIGLNSNCMVIDECQDMSNPDAGRTKNVIEICRGGAADPITGEQPGRSEQPRQVE